MRLVSTGFRAFLLVYVGFLVLHTLKLDWQSQSVLPMFLLGLGVAVAAHYRLGALSIVLLCLHMGFEWREHAQHGYHYSQDEILLHSMHCLLDITFLASELSRLSLRFRIIGGVSILSSLVWIFVVNYTPPPQKHPFLTAKILSNSTNHSHKHGPLHGLLLGGMIGCVLTHLFERKKRN